MHERTPRVTRRRLLIAGAGAATAGMLAACGGSSSTPVPRVRALPAGRPDWQFAWDNSLRSDGFGNRTAPKHHRLVHLQLTGPPTVAAAARLEDGLRAIEESTPSGPRGLLLLVGWGPSWFNLLDQPSPVPEPTALTADEAPDLDRFVGCVHLASDSEQLLETAETQLRRAIRSPFAVADRRTGFTAAGIPRRLSGTVNGIPAGQPRKTAPLFMGFSSGFARNQAREEDIVIADGAWAGAATMHVSVLSLALATWYGSLDERQRAARMFAPEIKLEQVLAPRDGIDPPTDVVAAAKRHGLVGHAQSMAALRRNGRPRILRRDFNGLDGKQPLVHFVALQRSIEDFVLTRQAMAATAAVAADKRVTPHINNGINEWTTTRSRANYIVPPRTRRTCPGLSGWDG
jgi:hypothetical protein